MAPPTAAQYPALRTNLPLSTAPPAPLPAPIAASAAGPAPASLAAPAATRPGLQPPLLRGEALGVTQNGCGIIASAATQAPGRSFDPARFQQDVAGQVWTGSCIETLASGWGALRNAAEASQADPSQASAEYVTGRATGRSGLRDPVSGAQTEIITVHGRTAQLTSYAGSPPLVRWGFSEFIFPPQGLAKPPKEELTRITAPEGSSVATLKAYCSLNEEKVPACIGKPANVIYGVSIEPKGAPAVVAWCPDPFTSNGCNQLWDQASASIRGQVATLVAEQSAYVQKMNAEVAPLMSDWAARKAGGASAASPSGAPAGGVIDDASLFAQAFLYDSSGQVELAMKTRQTLLDRFPNSPLASSVRGQLAKWRATLAADEAERSQKSAAEEAERTRRSAYFSERDTLISNCRNVEAKVGAAVVAAACSRMIEMGYEDKSDLALAHQYRAGARLETRAYADAIADYSVAIEADPDAADAYASRGAAYIFAGAAEKAIADLDNAITLGPAKIWHYVNRGMAHRLRNDAAKAMDDFTKVLSLEPGHLGAMKERAALHVSQQAWQKAIEDYTSLIAADAGDLTSLVNRGVAYYNLRSYQLALADLDKAIVIDPKNVTALASRGNSRWMLMDLEGALSDYDQALAIDPENAGARANRANVAAQLPAKP